MNQTITAMDLVAVIALFNGGGRRGFRIKNIDQAIKTLLVKAGMACGRGHNLHSGDAAGLNEKKSRAAINNQD